jgi:predicted DNA-binding WGR domain protein
LLSGSTTAAQALHKRRSELLDLANAHETASMAAANWREPLAETDTEAAFEVAKRLEPSALRWLQPVWWKLRKEIARRYDFSRHAVAPSLTSVLAALLAQQAAARAWQRAKRLLSTLYTCPDADRFLAAVDALQARRGKDSLLDQWLASLASASDPLSVAERDAQTGAALARIQTRSVDALSLPSTMSIGALAEALRDLRENLEDLPDLVPLLRAMHQADPAYAELLCTQPHTPEVMEALVAREALARIQRDTPEMAQFDGQALARTVATVAAADARLLDQNAALVRATQHAKFLDNVRRSSLSATQLDAAGREFRKRYSTGRRELEHEFGKSMRYRSIREMAGGDSGLVVNDLKPIWLMSPLSVSDTLPLAPDLFDVVIFDEASQIPIEDAVPALSRARQSVVVGDEMQLPPTSFFSAGGDAEDDEVVAEEDGERIAITLDADSLLSQAARNLPATLLAWHYRSRHEALISFSNAAFYDGRLVTIPDRRLDQTQDALTPRRSDQEDAGSAGVDSLLASPITFHAIADGVYEDRRNVPEAAYIARLVRELLRRDSGHSIGVVAFSEAQQGEIESALESLASADSEFASALEREYVREDDDQFNGLFVKNLENVQGDERDVIILSICYAPGRDGRMLMNFGPINQRGGEKRLNVIFSRAKHRMAVVSTIRADAITNVHNDGAAALKAFLQFAQASAAGETERSQAVLGTLNPGAQKAFASPPPADAVRTAIAAALRARGHEVREHVGRSSFRCDLGIVAPGGDGYALAVLLDPPGSAEDARQRYVFRPAILRAFGWRVLDLPCLDWLRDPAKVLARIETRLSDGEEPLSERAEEVLLPPPPASATPDAPAAVLADASRSLLFEESGSSKFWRIARNGGELSVSFGRIGSKGQSLLKTYDTAERAEREMVKLVDEKLRRGYRDGAD